MAKGEFYVAVRIKQPDGTYDVEEGSDSEGNPYHYLTLEQAENAARLWGDAWLMGDVWAAWRAKSACK